MATCTRTVWKVLAGCQRQLLRAGGPAPPNPPVRTLAAVKPMRKDKKEEAAKEAKPARRVVDDAGRHKPYGRTAWAPVDDVYFVRYYPRQVHGVADAIHMLKKFQRLDFAPVKQPVYIDLRLDMKLEKKKRVDSFVSTVHLPHPFRTEMNRVLVFTEDADQARAALEGGAVLAGGVELIQSILDEEISADYYVAVPAILPKLVPLKNKLRKKFPKGKRGSVSSDIPQMLELFQKGHEVLVENDCYVRTQIATLDMSTEQILSNLRRVLMDVCSHRPANTGPFIERAIIASQTSEALWFRSQDVLPEDKANSSM
ncbi:39S ribosomal protein L1, mitochondrial isoform X2 [Pungitius pungitius]